MKPFVFFKRPHAAILHIPLGSYRRTEKQVKGQTQHLTAIIPGDVEGGTEIGSTGPKGLWPSW